MIYQERLKNYPLHDSYRGYFGRALYKEMAKNPKVVLLTADLGYKLFDPHFEDFPQQCISVGASEQAMLGIGVGMALKGLIPFCYSITPFLLYRPAEWIRNYLHHEKIPVKLVGAGVGKDDLEDGIYCSTGSLGMGITVAVGMALADRKNKVYVLMSDGECAEGEVLS